MRFSSGLCALKNLETGVEIKKSYNYFTPTLPLSESRMHTQFLGEVLLFRLTATSPLKGGDKRAAYDTKRGILRTGRNF